MDMYPGKTKLLVVQCFCAVVSLLPFFCHSVVAGDRRQNLDNNGLALEGYDPVSYHSDSPRKGQPEFTLKVNGVTYYFVDQVNRTLFSENPDQFTPAYGGWCAWAMLDGERVEIDPESYKVIEGRTYLFYNGFWGNTLKKWNQRAEKETEMQLVQEADKQWKNIPAE